MKRVRFNSLNRFLAPPRGRFFFCALPQPSTHRTTAAAPAAADKPEGDLAALKAQMAEMQKMLDKLAK